MKNISNTVTIYFGEECLWFESSLFQNRAEIGESFCDFAVVQLLQHQIEINLSYIQCQKTLIFREKEHVQRYNHKKNT